MLDKFIECLCNENYSVLVISGTPSQEEILKSWEELYMKYLEVVGGDELQDRVVMIKEISAMTFRIERAEALLEVLSVAPSEGLYEQIYSLGYNIQSLPYNESNINILAKRVTAFMKLDVVNIKILIERLNSKTTDKKQTEADFYNMLAEIGDTFKIVLKEQETSVMTFAIYFNKYKQKVEQLNRQHLKTKGI